MYHQLDSVTHGPIRPGPSWGRIWLAAAFRPSRSTYAAIAGVDQAGVGPALVWMFASALLAGVLNTLASLVFGSAEQAYFDAGLLIAIPALAAITTLSWLAFAGSTFMIGRWLGGTSQLGKLAYSLAAASAPLGIVSSLIASLPGIGWLSLGIYLYWLALFVVVVVAVHRVTVLRALIAVVGSVVALGLVYGGLLIALGFLNRSLT